MNEKLVLSNSQRNKFVFATAVIITGCFLPWEMEGDFISHVTHGIQIYPTFVDNGGSLILLFCFYFLALLFPSSSFTNRPTPWLLFNAISLVILSTYNIADLWIRNIASQGIIGAPTIRFGLILMELGALANLGLSVTLFFTQRKTLIHQENQP